MNRKKTIDYTVTRRPRERDSSKFRQDSSSREARGRDDGNSRSKTPFWSNNDKNLGSQANFSTLQMLDKLKDTETGSLYDRKRNPLLSNLQKEISRDVPSQHDRDKFGTFGKVIGSGFSRGQSRGPIIDVFSEDSHSLYSDSNSKRTDSSNSKDWQHRRTDKNDSQRKRSHSPDDELLSSNWRIRGGTTTKRSHSKSLNPSSQCMDEDVDLRSVLKQFQKSRWEDNSEDVFDSGFSADYRDDDHQRKKGPYDDSVKGSDCREPRDSLRTR